MVVELQLRKQIAESDAQKSSRRKSQSIGDRRFAWLGHDSPIENKRSERDGQRENDVDQMLPRQRPTATSHQCGDGHRIERFVEQNDKERPQPSQRQAAVSVLNARCQSNAGDHAVEGEPKSGATPSEIMSVVVFFIILIMVVMAGNFAVLDVVVMEAEITFDKKHRHQAGQYPEHDSEFETRCIGIAEPGLHECMRQHVQQANAEHHAGDKAYGQFHAPVSQSKPGGDHPASDRSAENEKTVVSEKYEGRHSKCRMLNDE